MLWSTKRGPSPRIFHCELTLGVDAALSCIMRRIMLRLQWLIVLWRRFLQCSLTFLTVKMFYCLLELHLDCSFLLDLLLHSLCSFCHCFPSCHLLLHGSQTLILLAKPCQLVLNDCFNFFFRILLRLFLVFFALVLV
jgi:hypothetical protein